MKTSKILLSFLMAFLICQFSMAQTKHTVSMVSFEFQPANLTIDVGDTVMWENQAAVQHTTTSGTTCLSDGMWDSGLLGQGQTFTYVFDSAGSYAYFCIPHCATGMTGNITVDTSTATGIASLGNPGEKPVEILGIVPNPFKDYTRIEFKVNQVTQIRARLVNVAGQEKFSTPALSKALGEQQTTISTADLESGIYFLHLMENGKVVAVHKLFKM